MCYADLAAVLRGGKLGVSPEGAALALWRACSERGLRRFELMWDPEAFVATHPAIEPVFRDLAVRGYPADLQFLMLHPVAVFDGTSWHRDRADMPLLRGHKLESPVAALRVASRDL